MKLPLSNIEAVCTLSWNGRCVCRNKSERFIVTRSLKYIMATSSAITSSDCVCIRIDGSDPAYCND